MTKRFAVLGYPVGQSKSPKIFKFLNDHFKMDLSYEALEIHPNSIFDLKLLEEYDGLNITSPYKQKILEFVSEKSSDVEILKASNLIKKKPNGKFEAHNADVYGLKESLKGFSMKDKRVLVLGSSGAARASILALNEMGASQIYVKARDYEKLSHFQIPTKKYSDEKVQVIIQATTIGLGKSLIEMRGSSDLDFYNIDYTSVEMSYDLNYSPAVTPFMEISKNNGVPSVSNGKKMLIYQALKSFEIWYDLELSDAKKQELSTQLEEIL